MAPKKGGKGKKKGKKIPKDFNRKTLTRADIIAEQDDAGMIVGEIWYAQINKVMSGEKLHVVRFDDKGNKDMVEAYVTKSLRRNKPKKGGYLLIQKRQFNSKQYDAIHFYNIEDAKFLVKKKEVPVEESSLISFEEEDKTLTADQKRELRKQKNQGGTYLDMDALFDMGSNNNMSDEEYELTEEEEQLYKDVTTFVPGKNNNDDETDSDDLEIDVDNQYESE